MHLQVSHARIDGIRGAPVLIDDLRKLAYRVGQQRVARLIKRGALVSVHSRRGVRTTRRGPDEYAAADLVQRDLTATAQDQLWVAGFT